MRTRAAILTALGVSLSQATLPVLRIDDLQRSPMLSEQKRTLSDWILNPVTSQIIPHATQVFNNSHQSLLVALIPADEPSRVKATVMVFDKGTYRATKISTEYAIKQQIDSETAFHPISKAFFLEQSSSSIINFDNKSFYIHSDGSSHELSFVVDSNWSTKESPSGKYSISIDQSSKTFTSEQPIITKLILAAQKSKPLCISTPGTITECRFDKDETPLISTVDISGENNFYRYAPDSQTFIPCPLSTWNERDPGKLPPPTNAFLYEPIFSAAVTPQKNVEVRLISSPSSVIQIPGPSIKAFALQDNEHQGQYICIIDQNHNASLYEFVKKRRS